MTIQCVTCGFVFVPTVMMEPCAKCELRESRDDVKRWQKNASDILEVADKAERDLATAKKRIERLERSAERVYDALFANLDNMSQHNQNALRPVAMELLAALANESTAA